MPDDIVHLKFDDMSKPVKFVGCSKLIECLESVFPTWNIIEVSPADSGEIPILAVTREDNAYCIDGFWLDKPMHRVDKVDAACGLVAELIRAYVREDPQLLCLHGASAKFSEKLVIFPSQYRSGKSVLSACLASVGVQLYGDDVLPISLSQTRGIAPGLAVRLRRSLPETLARKSLDFIRNHTGLTGKNYQYLDLEDDRLAPKGSQAEIGAFVLLEREEGARTAFEEVSEAEVLHQVVWQNFAREAEAPHILEVLSQLVAKSQYYRLRFDRAEDAVKLLTGKFKTWPDKAGHLKRKLAQSEVNNEYALLPGYFSRKPDTRVIQVGDDSFIANKQGAAIHYLNTIGTAIWTLLAEPMRIDDMVDLLLTAFPEIDADSTRIDVTELINELMKKRLLLSGDKNEHTKEVG